MKDDLHIVGLSMVSGEERGMVQEAKQGRHRTEKTKSPRTADPRKANLLWLSAKTLELPVPVGHPHWMTNPILFWGGLQFGLYP